MASTQKARLNPKAAKTRKPSGGPTTFTPKVAHEICEFLASGGNLAKRCREDPDFPGYSTIWQWLTKHPTFAEDYGRARECQAEVFHDQVLEIADNPDLLPDQKRVMVDARKWSTSHQFAKKYGDRRVIAGDSDAPVLVKHSRVLDVSLLSLEQLEALKPALELTVARLEGPETSE